MSRACPARGDSACNRAADRRDRVVMRTLFDSVVARLRRRFKTPSGFVNLALVVNVLGLTVQAADFGRPSLHGRLIRICSTVPPEDQAYQIARAVCAYLLIEMSRRLPREQHLIRYLSPHDLAVSLFDVTAADEQVIRALTALAEAKPLDTEGASVHWLGTRRRG